MLVIQCAFITLLFVTVIGEPNPEDHWRLNDDLCAGDEPGPPSTQCDPTVETETRWYYNRKTGNCLDFDYTCDGSINNYQSKHMCELFCIHDEGPNIVDMTLELNFDSTNPIPPTLLMSDTFRRDARLQISSFCEIEPEYVRQVNVAPQGRTSLLLTFKITKDGRIKPFVAGNIFLNHVESGRLIWDYHHPEPETSVRIWAVPRSQTTMYGSNDITVKYKNMLIAFGAVAVLLGFTACISTICMFTILNKVRKTIRDSIEKSQKQKKVLLHQV